jgi:hypothetical protein
MLFECYMNALLCFLFYSITPLPLICITVVVLYKFVLARNLPALATQLDHLHTHTVIHAGVKRDVCRAVADRKCQAPGRSLRSGRVRQGSIKIASAQAIRSVLASHTGTRKGYTFLHIRMA